MTLVTPQQFRQRTGDTTHFWSQIEAWLADAQAQVEDALDRHLELGSYTEDLPVDWRYGYAVVYPTARPVATVEGDWTLEMNGRRLKGGASIWPNGSDLTVEPYRCTTQTVTVTYTGGFTAATLPVALRYGIIDLANAANGPAPAVPAIPNAQMIRSADQQVQFFAPGSVLFEDLDALVPGLSGRLAGFRNRL